MLYQRRLTVGPYGRCFICAPDVCFKIADGELNPVAAFTEQKLRVEGNIEKALRLKEIIEMKNVGQNMAAKENQTVERR